MHSAVPCAMSLRSVNKLDSRYSVNEQRASKMFQTDAYFRIWQNSDV